MFVYKAPHSIPCSVAMVLAYLGPPDSSIRLNHHDFSPSGDKRKDILASTLPLLALPEHSHMFGDDEQAFAKGWDASHTSYFCHLWFWSNLARHSLSGHSGDEISCIMTAQNLSGQLRPRRPTQSQLFGFSEFVHDDIIYLPIYARSPRFCCQAFVPHLPCNMIAGY